MFTFYRMLADGCNMIMIVGYLVLSAFFGYLNMS